MKSTPGLKIAALDGTITVLFEPPGPKCHLRKGVAVEVTTNGPNEVGVLASTWVDTDPVGTGLPVRPAVLLNASLGRGSWICKQSWPPSGRATAEVPEGVRRENPWRSRNF